MPDTFTCRLVDLDAIFALRWAILRPGFPREAAEFDGDHDPATLHAGAFTAAGDCIGCALAMLNELDARPAYQLRGMATRPDWQRRGVGRALLAHIQQHIAEHTPVRQLWCNARVEAVGFYERQGWRIISDVFEVPTVGPHHRMSIHLPT